MFIICKSNVSIKCQKITSRHGHSAGQIFGICDNCKAALRNNAEKKETTLEDLLKGDGHGRQAKTRG